MFSYLLAVVLTAAAVAVRWLLDPWLGDRVPLVTLYGAVAAVIWLGGYRPAVLAAVLGYLACDYLFIEPRGSFDLTETPNLVGMLAYAVSCAIIIGFGEAMRVAQARAKARRDLLRITLASIGDAVITTDKEGRVTSLNAVAEALTGWTQVEAVGQPLGAMFSIVNQQTRQTVENPVTRALREDAIVGLANHSVLIGKDGTERLIDDSAAPIRDEQDRRAGCVLVFRDVTERQRAEEAQALLAAIVAASDDAIISKSLEGTILSWNAGAERLFGYSAAEAVGRSITLIIPPELSHEESSILDRLRRGERVDHYETVRVSKHGRRIDISVTISPIRDSAGRVVGASKVARDITDRKRGEQAVRESERQFRLMADAAPVLMWLSGTDKLCTWFNKQWLNFVGRSMERELGNGWAENVHPGDLERRFETYATAFDTRQTFSMEYRLRRHDGEYRWLLDNGIPFFGPDGEFSGYIGSCIDITDRKVTEEALKDADRRKDQFLAMLAHEIRNPLAPVRNALEIMKRAQGNAGLVEQARETMDRQVSQMERLIGDLLDISRITANRLNLRKRRVELRSVVAVAVETCRPLAEGSRHELTVTLPAQPIYLNGDPVRLAQVFGNLLNNACNYTQPGGRIALTAERQGSEVVVSVKDNGIGIPADTLPQIFDMFIQVDRGFEFSHDGLGIGLNLVKQLVEMHDGSVEALSAGPGLGSEFVVRLPILVEKPGQHEPPGSTATRPVTVHRRVLVVDDNKDSAESLAILLGLAGHEAHVAHDGLAAIEAAERFCPEVVLLDIGLPKLNGFDACRRMRQQPWGENMVVVALTGWGQDEDRRKSQDAGFDGHLVKPVDLAALMRLLASLPSEHRSAKS